MRRLIVTGAIVAALIAVVFFQEKVFQLIPGKLIEETGEVDVTASVVFLAYGIPICFLVYHACFVRNREKFTK